MLGWEAFYFYFGGGVCRMREWKTVMCLNKHETQPLMNKAKKENEEKELLPPTPAIFTLYSVYTLRQYWLIFFAICKKSIRGITNVGHSKIAAKMRKTYFGTKIVTFFSFLDFTLFEKSNFCPKIQFWQEPNIFTNFSPNFFFNNFSREIKVVNS